MRTRSLWHSFQCAFVGLWYVLRTERNMKIHFAISVLVILLAAILKLEVSDWSILVLAIGAIIAAEVGNTSIEAIVDLIAPEFHEQARIAKDVAAAAVLVLAGTAVVVGLLLIGPPLWIRLSRL